MSKPVVDETFEIQLKSPYTALSLGGLKLRYGETMQANSNDPRILKWFEKDFVEKVPAKPKPTKTETKGKVE